MRIRIPALLAAVAAAVFAIAPAASTAKPKPFELGVASGDVSASSAVLWSRYSKPANVKITVATNPGITGPVKVATLRAAKLNDFTVKYSATDLMPKTTYYYRFSVGKDRSQVGQFETSPLPTDDVPTKFAYSGDTDASPEGSGVSISNESPVKILRSRRKPPPFFNRFEVFGLMAREGNDFNIHLGDTIYSDSTADGARDPIAVNTRQKWAKYRMNLGLANYRTIRSQQSMYSEWDDHEFINDFCVQCSGNEIFERGRKAFLDYTPVQKWDPNVGLYRKVRWGKNVELFILDERSFMDRPADQFPVCHEGESLAERQDLAPTAPQAMRSKFSSLIPALAQPVAPDCLSIINDPSRTFLGKAQKEQFKQDIAASDATWKVVVNERPMQEFYAYSYDRWEGFAPERKEIINFLRENVRNTVFLTTDMHANLYNEVKMNTLAPDTVNSGIYEFVTGPVAARRYAKSLEFASGIAGLGDVLSRIFFMPKPPNGVGVICSQLEAYSYMQIQADASTFKLKPRGIDGGPIRDTNGKLCGPTYTLTRSDTPGVQAPMVAG